MTPHLSVRGFYGTTARRITDDQGLGADIVLAMVQALRCSACGDAIGAYEEDMRGFAYPVMEMSADHDRFGGGGLRQRDKETA